jgi:hypothetical protein
MKISVHYASNGCPWEISLLWQTSCWFSWWFLQTSSQSLNIVGCPCRSWPTTVSFIFIPNTSCFPELFQEMPDCEVCWEDFSRESPSWMVAEWGLPISLQNMPPQSLTSLAQCIELLDPLMPWDENLRLYLWFTWKWERYVSYCGTGKNLIRVTFFGPPCYRSIIYFLIWNYNLTAHRNVREEYFTFVDWRLLVDQSGRQYRGLIYMF